MSENVNQIFSSIAQKYDFINTMLTFNIDRLWRKRAIRLCHLSNNDKVLDLCCGTGEMCIELCKSHTLGITVTGMDFNEDMLKVAYQKVKNSTYYKKINFVQGDILSLPFPDASFDVVTIAFGIRNIADKKTALSEIRRVLKPGGRFICLELSQADMHLLQPFYSFYFNHILPLIGFLVSGDQNAYRYLRDSVNHFLNKTSLKVLFSDCGFVNTGFRSLTGGIAAIHYGTKS